MTNIDFVNLSSTFGLIATGLFLLNLLLGLMLTLKVRREWWWLRLPFWMRSISVFAVHNWTAYAALLVALVHPGLLLLAPKSGFNIKDIAIPLYAPHQRYLYSLGAVALYFLIAVTISSMHGVRAYLPNRYWKWVHYLAFAATPLFLVHGLLVDSKLTDKPIDLLDAEKLLSEAGLVIFVIAAVVRIRYEFQKRASEQFYELRVQTVMKETAEATSCTFEIPSQFKKIFRYKPGQFVTLRVGEEHGYVKRSYSLSSSPIVDSNPTITIKRAPGGRVSSYLIDHLHEGEILEVLPPEGAFFDRPVSKSLHYVLFAAGSGITPLYSILKIVLALYPKSTVSLFYLSRNEHSIIFREGLLALESRFQERLQIVYQLSQPSASWQGLRGRPDRTAVEQFVQVPMHTPDRRNEYYVCGPAEYMDLVEGVLHQQGVPRDTIHAERFSFSSPDHTEGKEPLFLESPPETTGQTFRLDVRIAGERRSIEINETETILDAMMRVGLNPPFACQQGVCASCKASLLSGSVTMPLHEALTPLDLEQNAILTCQAFPSSETLTVSFER
jgi:ferredoxin-NADP reductase